MSFNESNTVEQMILDAVENLGRTTAVEAMHDKPGLGASLGGDFKPCSWSYVPGLQVPRQPGDVMVESWLREALLRLNPEIAAQPDRADEVIYALRATILSVQADGLVRANENFMAWLRGEKTMPFGHNGDHVSVRLVDTVQPANNRFTVVNQWTYQTGVVVKRFDVVLLVNGLPVVIGEAKTPTRSAVTWFDGAFQVNEIYERQVPAMFVPNVFFFATDGRLYRFGSIRMPIEMWSPWRTRENEPEGSLADVGRTVENMLRREVVLDILQSFTLFATDKKHRRIKVICRYQQYLTTNQLIERVVKGYPKKGLIWHFRAAASRCSWSSPRRSCGCIPSSAIPRSSLWWTALTSTRRSRPSVVVRRLHFGQRHFATEQGMGCLVRVPHTEAWIVQEAGVHRHDPRRRIRLHLRDRPDKVSCTYGDNPGSNRELLLKLGGLATNDVPLLHVCGNIDPVLGKYSTAIEGIFRTWAGAVP